MKWIQERMLTTLALATLGVLATGCSDKPTTIGVVIPLDGEDSVYGVAVSNGINLAYEEILAQGEQTPEVLLSIQNTGSDPTKAKELLNQVFDDGALLALGGITSAEAKEMVSIADKYNRVVISPSASSPDLTGISSNFYRIWPSDFAAASKMAQFVSQDLKLEEVVIVAEEKDYAKGIQGAFASAFGKLGGEVTEVVEFPANTSEFSGLIERVITLNPKAVYLAAYGEDIGSMIQELRKVKFKGYILTTSAFASAQFIVPVGEAAAGVILTQSVFELDSDHAHLKNFVEAYRAKYDADPDIFAAHGYDAMKVAAAAINGRAALPSEVPKGLRDIKDFPGVTGSISFNDKGDVLKYPRLYVISRELVLQDYNERVRQQQEEIRRKREELRRKLDALNQQAEQISG
jgi:branched-chain amino acid transport system substrate-binding protein